MDAKKTFTLIEMLIVIVIIGILAAALVPRLQSVQSRARDTKRKADLHAIVQGVNIYLADNGMYPTAANALGTCANPPNGSVCYVYDNNAAMRISGLNTIVTSLPKDPRNNAVQNTVGTYTSGARIDGYYMYAYGNVARKSVNGIDHFDLFTQLENRQDPDRNELKRYTYSYSHINLYPSYSARLYDAGP